MRTAIISLTVVGLLFFAGCGSRKPAATVAETGVTEGQGVTVRPDDTEIKDEDVKKVDEGVKISGGEVKERRITDMTLEEINEAGFLQNIYFDFDKYDLRDDSITHLGVNAQWLLDNSSVHVMIEGHCDERGTEEYNMSLGEKRALATYNYLVSRGIDGSRMSLVSYGESRPLDPGHDESAWAENRRAHFRVIKK